MKKNSFILAVLCTAAITSCSNYEMEWRAIPESQKETPVTITFGISDESTKATLDREGLKWAEGDVIRFSDKGLGNAKDVTLKKSDISVDGYTATITEDSFYLGNGAVFRHNWSPRNASEWDFGYMGNYAAGCSFTEREKLSVKQAAAGQINKSFVFLHSGMNYLSPEAGTTEFSVTMEILGTILRVLPYSTTPTDEVIQSVSLISEDRLGGCVAVNYTNGTYRDHKDVGWGPDTFKEYKVSLTEGFSLDGVTDRAHSQGIYFSLPATNAGHEIAGYTYVVETDKKAYTFDASAVSLSLNQNKVRNVGLDLDKATSVEDLTVINGVYWFDGNIDNRDLLFTETSIADLGYWVAYSQDTGSATVNALEHASYPEIYDALSISIIDNETGTDADWLTYGYNADSHLNLHAEANPSVAPRSATVTITPPSAIRHYNLRDGSVPKVVTITQEGKKNIAPVISGLSGKIPSAGGNVTATIDLTIEGTPATTSEFASYSSLISLNAESPASVSRTDHTLNISASANPTTSPRTFRITVTTGENSTYIDVEQDASDGSVIQTYTYGFDGWQTGANQTFTRESGADEFNKSDWMILISNPIDDLTGSYPADMWDLVKYGFNLSDAELLELQAFAKLHFEVDGITTRIWFDGFYANTTGATRVFDKYFLTSDTREIFVHVTFRQAKNYSLGENMWPDLTVNTAGSYYGPGWAAQSFPAIDKGVGNSSYSFTIPTACNERWQCQLKLETDLPALISTKTYNLSLTINCSKTNSVRVQFGKAGFGFPADDDVTVTASEDYVYSKTFTGTALNNATLILDFGYAPAETEVYVSDISISEVAAP